MKRRTSDDTMHHLKKAKIDDFTTVDKRGRALVRDLSGRGNHVRLDWRLGERARLHKVVEIQIGKETAQVSEEELQRYLRHV